MNGWTGRELLVRSYYSSTAAASPLIQHHHLVPHLLLLLLLSSDNDLVLDDNAPGLHRLVRPRRSLTARSRPQDSPCIHLHVDVARIADLQSHGSPLRATRDTGAAAILLCITRRHIDLAAPTLVSAVLPPRSAAKFPKSERATAVPCRSRAWTPRPSTRHTPSASTRPADGTTHPPPD